MYAVVKNGAVIGLCDKPRYVEVVGGVYVETKPEKASHVAIGGVAHDLTETLVQEVDGSEAVFSESIRLDGVKSATDDAQDALCEVTEDFETRITDIENALCELSEVENE